MLLANDKKTLDLYNAGRTKKTFGNVLIYGGIATMMAKLLVDANSSTSKTTNSSAYNSPINTKQETRTATGYIIGGAMILGGAIIKAGF
jgi:predicted phage tail protein